MIAQWIEQTMKTVSITKCAVQDEEFQFHQTFISILYLAPPGMYLIDHICYDITWTPPGVQMKCSKFYLESNLECLKK